MKQQSTFMNRYASADNRSSLMAARTRKRFYELNPQLNIGCLVQTPQGNIAEFHGVSCKKEGIVTILLYRSDKETDTAQEIYNLRPDGLHLDYALIPRPYAPDRRETSRYR